MVKSNQINLILGDKMQPEVIFITLGLFVNLEILFMEKKRENFDYLDYLINVNHKIITINRASSTNLTGLTYFITGGDLLNPSISLNDIILVDKIVFEEGGLKKIKINQLANQKLAQYFYQNQIWQGPIIIENTVENQPQNKSHNKLKNQIQGYLAQLESTNLINNLTKSLLEKQDSLSGMIVLPNNTSINQQVKIFKSLLDSFLN